MMMKAAVTEQLNQRHRSKRCAEVQYPIERQRLHHCQDLRAWRPTVSQQLTKIEFDQDCRVEFREWSVMGWVRCHGATIAQ